MIRYILTDIEGTTTSVSFVFDTLFPYFLAHINVVADSLDNPFVQQQIQLAQQTIQDEEQRACTPAETLAYFVHWTKTDRKHPALKALQGWVWRLGYESGALKGHLYSDVSPCLNAWIANGLRLGVYSSGSVAAQKLLFGYSEAGDLTPLFSNYFDTGVGHKREASSYQHIQAALQIPANEILFLSDIEAELDAAEAAGFQTYQLVRAGTTPSLRHRQAATFEDIQL